METDALLRTILYQAETAKTLEEIRRAVREEAAEQLAAEERGE